ncbi:hypothetical protein [Stenotrophomonas sp.]|uniref:hypothetical protein n=1 Tax=Stenotrophomonas sp. TaxID=69392 RepID=UPI0028997B30|nr:hypothetical protein [Stenotrophomonas sp.]
MRKLDRIYFDGLAWNFSRYFDYIDTVASEMPASLHAFASDVDSYSLGGNKTLHDARILSLVVSKQYEGRFSNGQTLIALSLIDQMFEGMTTLRYGGVSSFQLCEPALEGNGHADLLLHEFSIVRPGVYRHHIILDHDGELQIEFTRFSHEWTPLPT